MVAMISPSTTKWSYGKKIVAGLIKFVSTIQGMIVITIFTVGVVILYLPNLVLRRIAIRTSRLILGYEKIFSPVDIFTYEEVVDSSSAPRRSLVTTAVLKGDMSLKEAQNIFKDKVLDATITSENTRQLRYPELQQHEVNWMGFRFMKNQKDFKVADYIKEWSGHHVSSISEIHQILMNKTFTPKKSSWELILFRNVISGHIVLGFRIHHSVADGLSILKLFVEGLGQKQLVNARPQEKQRRIMEKFWYWVGLPASLGNDYVTFWKDVVQEFRSGGVLKKRSAKGSFQRFVWLSESISMGDVKTVAKTFNVTSSAIIMGGVLGGLENFMRKEYGEQTERNVAVGYVLPMEKHPARFANHWTTTYTVVKYGGAKTREEKLRGYNASFLEMKSGTRRTLLKQCVVYGGACVTKLANALLKNRVCSVGITNIAGDDEGFQVEGRECVDFSLSSGGLDGINLIFCIMSYKGNFRVTCISERGALEENEVKELSSFIYNEFQHLKNAAAASKKENQDKLIYDYV